MKQLAVAVGLSLFFFLTSCDGGDKAQQTSKANEIAQNVPSESADDIRAYGQPGDAIEAAKSTVQESVEAVKQKGSEFSEKAEQKMDEVVGTVAQTPMAGVEKAQQGAEGAGEMLQEKTGETTEQAGKAVTNVLK